MGTRSLTRVRDDKKIIVNIYRQMDGYPEGQGIDISNFLQDRVIGNGISYPAPEKFSNGVHDLAAQLVAHLKNDSPVGGIYLYHPDEIDCGEEYIYDVFLSYNEKDCWVRVTECYHDKVIFYGSRVMFIDWCLNGAGRDNDGEYTPVIHDNGPKEFGVKDEDRKV